MLILKYWTVVAVAVAVYHYVGAQQSQMCPATGKDFLAHYSNCSLFFECHDGVKTLDSCPLNFTWSFWEKKCVFQDWGDCSFTTLTPPTAAPTTTITENPNEGCPNWGLSYVPDYSDCHYYYECNFGIKTRLKCPKGKAWSIPQDACELEIDVDCSYTTIGTTTVSPAPGLCPSTGQSYLPDYADCTSFYFCDNGVETLKQCFDGYAWNIQLEACDLIENVDCSYTTLYPNQTTPSTTSPLTETTPTTVPTTTTPPETTTPSGTTAPPDSSCEGQNNGAYIPHPYDCTKFIMCFDGNANIYTCPSGESWDQDKKRCDTNNEENCKNSTVIPTTTTTTTTYVTTTPAPTTIPPNDWCVGQKNGAYLPHPTDCTKFLICMDEKATVVTCPDGESWDQDAKKCDDNNEENCKYLSTTPMPTTEWVDPICKNDDPDKPTYHAHPYNCSMFFECIHGTSEVLSCERGYLWDAVRNICNVDDEVDCSYTSPLPTSTVSSNQVCKYENDGTVLPHPTDCKKFILCMDNIQLISSCSRTTSWNQETQACIASNGNCVTLHKWK